MGKEPVAFQIGDSVVVKEGVRDPDDETVELGGWQGRVVETSYDDGGSPLVDIQWDGPTLREMSQEFIAANLMLGLDYTSICLGADQVQLASPRDTPEEAEAAALEIEENFISQIIPPEAQDAIIEYTKIRDELFTFHKEAFSMLTAEEMNRAGKQLGISPKVGLFVFNSEEEMSVLADFALYEMHRDGIPIIQHCVGDYTPDPEKSNLLQTIASALGSADRNQDEALLLDSAALGQAVGQSFTSLFQISQLSAEGLTLIDQLDPDLASYRLLDIGLMATGEPEMLIFSRLLPIRNYYVTGGAAFGFPAHRLEHLLRSYRNAIKGRRGHRVEVERYRFFHRASRRFGLEMWYK